MRGLILAVAVVAALVIVARPRCGGGWVLLSAAVLLLPAHAGRPAHKPIVTAATLPTTVQAPSQDVITRARRAGIAGIDRWLRDGRALGVPVPVREDGPGWVSRIGPAVTWHLGWDGQA